VWIISTTAAMRIRRSVVPSPRRRPEKKNQDRAQPLAASRLQVLVDVINGLDGGDRFESDFALDFGEIRPYQIEDLQRGKGFGRSCRKP